MAARVAIGGRGVAACCCAALLQRTGIAFSFDEPKHVSSSPLIMLNGSTQQLLLDIFRADSSLFDGFTSVRRRVVLWNSNEPVTFPHAGRVVREATLVERLWSFVRNGDMAAHGLSQDWSLRTQADIRLYFGHRTATSVEVSMRESDTDACWIESLEEGWLFLLPCGPMEGVMLSVGASPTELLDHSRLIAQKITSICSEPQSFSASPAIASQLAGDSWLACGAGAIAFDPICGEGAGNSAREAILATAVIDAAQRDESRRDLIEHYTARLHLGFLRHLQTSLTFYEVFPDRPWWQGQADELRRGIEWSRLQLSGLGQPKYCLNGLTLERLPESSR